MTQQNINKPEEQILLEKLNAIKVSVELLHKSSLESFQQIENQVQKIEDDVDATLSSLEDPADSLE